MSSRYSPTSSNSSVLWDADQLTEWLQAQGFVPYADFEFLAVTLSDGAIEIDPMGQFARLLPALESFSARFGYEVLPSDPETGNVCLIQSGRYV